MIVCTFSLQSSSKLTYLQDCLHRKEGKFRFSSGLGFQGESIGLYLPSLESTYVRKGKVCRVSIS